MSTSNENEPLKSSAPADPGPPEWLKAANASKERARTLFPKSTIGQTPRSTIGLPSEPVAPASASSAAAPAASTSPPLTTSPPLSGSAVDGPALPTPALPTPALPTPALPTPALPTPAPVAAEASHPNLPYTAPLTTSASSDAVPAIPTPPVRPATPAPSNPYAKPASSNPYATPAPGNPYATPAPGTTSAATLAGKGLSVTSLILGCIGVVLTIVYLGFFPALAAVITGHMAQRRQPAAKAFWMTGLVTGYLSLVLSTILVVWIVAIFVQSYAAMNAVP